MVSSGTKGNGVNGAAASTIGSSLDPLPPALRSLLLLRLCLFSSFPENACTKHAAYTSGKSQ